MQPEQLLKPRFKVIADYPGSVHKIGTILSEPRTGVFNILLHLHPEKYPAIFKRLEWWEHRTIEELKSVKYVKVIKYRGYWVVGDIVKVIRFEPGSTNPERPKPTGYYIGRFKGDYQPIFELDPATEQDYINQQSK